MIIIENQTKAIDFFNSLFCQTNDFITAHCHQTVVSLDQYREKDFFSSCPLTAAAGVIEAFEA
jgi:hypothetical protein